ncbi:unnamed protein product (macronuclear) [Paramecium tetraurelia]|uniref:Signal recognition particle receptor subunit beta n=1 Tax=Paramecium tetraurelia TaxID=5888 RepID=A0DTE3_PARTE|nr:uncharacterized protein GSPATT00019991001 [Paramecium tetraurelia]CAK86310.1 unnamed protein product [Paramecium tetraurelia]|eukprot:XP_001453707.1 hypothetical protein (macronuclear) [Paramecium tetraurelia strain d4-2]
MLYDKMLLSTQNIFSQFDNCQQKQLLLALIFSVLLGILILFLCYNSKKKLIYRKKLIMIGQPGGGKTILFNIATEKKIKRQKCISDVDQIYEFPINDHYDLVDTPSIEFEDSLDKREAIISQFNRYFKLHSQDIEKFYLIVNFERTDLMKANCLKTYKYFKKFDNIIDIVITNFQLSEDEIKDKEHLLQALYIYTKDTLRIHFVRNDIQSEELRQMFIQSANQVDLQDVDFEKAEDKESKKSQQNQTKQILNGKQYQCIEECNDS